MAQPRTWSPAELAEDAGAAKGRFRRTRLNEPLERYTRFFDAFTPIFTDLIDQALRLRRRLRIPDDTTVSSDVRGNRRVTALGGMRPVAFRQMAGWWRCNGSRLQRIAAA